MIQIIKLQNGENLIANVSLVDGRYLLEEPMEFDVEPSGNLTGSLVMRHWLPAQLLKKNEITIRDRDVLSILEPDDEFSEYYLNTIERIKRLMDARNSVDSLTDDEMKQMLEALSEHTRDDATLH